MVYCAKCGAKVVIFCQPNKYFTNYFLQDNGIERDFVSL